MNEKNEFGNCEECGNKLHEYPNATWGVGYVCRSCAYKIMNEEHYEDI